MVLILHEKSPLSSVSPLLSLSYFHLALQAFNHLFQTGASCTWSTGPKERDYVFKSCKEWDTVCVCVCVCAQWATLLSVRKRRRGREKGALTCKSLLLLYLPPLILSIATRIWAIMRRTHRLTALSCLNGCSWHVLHVHTHTNSSVLSERNQGGVCVSLKP